MNTYLKLLLGSILLLELSFNTNAQHSSKGMLSVALKHYVDSVALNMDSVVYKNEFGQTYTITNFKYYLSNFHLMRADGKEFISHDYFLINEEEELSKKIILNSIPGGEYTSISFMIGVDSAHNCSGAQSGALDPVHAMFWAWNSGYIFLKLEGKSVSAATPAHIFEYHIGGYKAPANCTRIVALKFPQAVAIEKDKTAVINFKVNVAEILKNPIAIDFTKLPSVTDSHNAEMLSDNYKDIFTIEK